MNSSWKSVSLDVVRSFCGAQWWRRSWKRSSWSPSFFLNARHAERQLCCALAGSIRLFSQLVSEAFIIVTNAPHESDAWFCQADHFILCAYSADGCVADMSLSDYLSSDSLWAQITK
jgi:hypothetical protein